MSAFNRIAYHQNRRDEVPNQQLARALSAARDRKGIREIAAGLWEKNRASVAIVSRCSTRSATSIPCPLPGSWHKAGDDLRRRFMRGTNENTVLIVLGETKNN